MVSRDVSGLPRQLMEMEEKSRCSILFHLLVAGGKWQTVMARPVSLAKCCTCCFHSRLRAPLEPPPSATISSSRLPGYSLLPTLFHQRLMLSTANSAVSWSMPSALEAAVLHQIIDAIRNGFPVRNGKVIIHIHGRVLPFGLPCSPAILAHCRSALSSYNRRK